MVCALVLTALAGTAYAAAQASKPGVTVQITPANRSVERGQSADYTISVSSTNGFTGVVALSVGKNDLPAGASAAFAPASVTLTAGGTATSVMTVTTVSSTPVGSYSLTVTGLSGKVSGTVTVGLTVNSPVTSSFSMSVTPASVTMDPGSTAVYTVQLARVGFPGAISFAVTGALPTGAQATFTPSSTTGNSSTLQITTTATTPDGSYPLTLVGSGPNPGGTIQNASASVQLAISTTGKAFTISGNLTGLLAPGSSRELDLTLSNPNRKSLAVSNLTVTVQDVARTAEAVARNLPCTAADYAVTQYGGPYPLTVPGSSSASLSNLGVPSSAWPRVAMLNATTNQDGCKNAALTLAFSGSGQGI